jgi:hypothetical protein
MEVGEHWAYEIPKKYELTEVRIEKIGAKRPPRVLVKFLDDEHEGASEWVPPSRLKVLWAAVGAYRAREEAWDVLRAESRGIEDVDSFAVEHVLLDRLPRTVATRLFNHGNYGMVIIHDWAGIEALTGQTKASFLRDNQFEEDGSTVCSWLTTVDVAIAVAAHHSDEVLRDLDKYEKDHLREVKYGRVERRQGREHFTEPELMAEWYDAYTAPMIAIIRGWCGEDLVRRDELNELRQEQWRVVALVNRAVDYLLDAKDEERAWRLHAEMYPDAVRKGWKSRHQLKIETDARLKAEREKEVELARQALNLRRTALEAKAEREKARLLDYEPPPWARD